MGKEDLEREASDAVVGPMPRIEAGMGCRVVPEILESRCNILIHLVLPGAV